MASPLSSASSLQGQVSRTPCRFVHLPVPSVGRVQPARSRRPTVRVQARESEAEETLKKALRAGNNVVDNLVENLPDEIPKDLAKPGTILIGIALIWWLFQKVISTVILLGVAGGAFYLWYTINKTDGDDDGEGGSDNPIDMAKKIMDKYK